MTNNTPNHTPDLPRTVLELATKAGVKLMTAESCTGGMVAAALTTPAGSSSAMWGGVVAYANDIKQQILGVTDEDLHTHGAVSPQVAAAMAEGAIKNSTATLAVSISGIAGPGGATSSKPVGHVEFATFLKGDKTAQTDTKVFKGNRTEVRLQATMHALVLLKNRLEAL
ncbi:MAG: damage-inducible protein CinA [Magnetococcales bacterium]|nr:damage-inducible protein CinA [Magnetococcales bacterium]